MATFRPIHFIQDGGLKNIEHIEIISRLDHLMNQLDAFQVKILRNNFLFIILRNVIITSYDDAICVLRYRMETDYKMLRNCGF